MFSKLTKIFQGRHTLFAVFFTLIGTALAWFHRLDPNFIALATVIQGAVFGHSFKETYFASKNGNQD